MPVCIQNHDLVVAICQDNHFVMIIAVCETMRKAILNAPVSFPVSFADSSLPAWSIAEEEEVNTLIQFATAAFSLASGSAMGTLAALPSV
jgi:hypothetical protein